MSDDSDPRTTAAQTAQQDGSNPWPRGLAMLAFMILFNVAQTVLVIAAVLQFLWLLFAKERNHAIADVGDSLSKWLAAVARFQTGATDDKPFPWRRWGA
jgi:hypothetical protein